MSVDYNLLKVTDLKELLNERGLAITGKKSELVERLLQSDGIDIPDGYVTSSISDNVNTLMNMTNDENNSAYSAQSTLEEVDGEENYTSNAVAENGYEEHIDNNLVYNNNNEILSIQQHNTSTTKNIVNNGNNTLINSTRNSTPNKTNITNPANFNQLTEEQKRLLRKKKFGIQTDEEKKLERAKRFGVTSPQLEEEKKRLRAERFGSLNVNDSTKKESGMIAIKTEEERRKSRALRFGIMNEEDKLKKRAERFGLLSEEEKKRRRIERFGSAGQSTAGVEKKKIVAAGIGKEIKNSINFQQKLKKKKKFIKY